MRALLKTWPSTLVVAGALAPPAAASPGEREPRGRACRHPFRFASSGRADLGYYEGPHDGIFGEDTQTALKQLQVDEGLDESGELDQPTLAVLRALAGKSDALAVKAVQTAAELGLYSGLIDGDYGPATEAAIEEVQREANLEVDGAFGPETAAALNERYEEDRLEDARERGGRRQRGHGRRRLRC